MKILQIRDKLARGGIEILLFDVLKNVSAFNLEMQIVTFSNGEFDKEFLDCDISIIKLKRQHPIDLGLVKSLRKVIIENKIEIVHSHQAIEGLYAFLATRGLDVKNVISHHGSTYPLKDKLVMKYLIPRIDANIAVSKSYLTRLAINENFNTKKNFHVVYNGIDQSKLDVTPSDLKRELHIPDSDLILGMVGNFYGSGRDQLTICKALPKLFKEFTNIHFVFVGGWSNENSVNFLNCHKLCKEQKILNRTHFLGARKDVGNILKTLDIFVYSSNHDTFGIAVVEAMLAGKPVVLNDIAPMLEISNNGEFAEIFKSKDTNSLLQALKRLINNSDNRNLLGQRGKIWASENYTISNHIKQLKLLYNRILS